MVQKIAKMFLLICSVVALCYFLTSIKESVQINLPRYPANTCIIIAAKLFYNDIEKTSIFKLGKINWKNREYVYNGAGTIGMPFYYSWSEDVVKVPCPED